MPRPPVPGPPVPGPPDGGLHSMIINYVNHMVELVVFKVNIIPIGMIGKVQ